MQVMRLRCFDVKVGGEECGGRGERRGGKGGGIRRVIEWVDYDWRARAGFNR